MFLTRVLTAVVGLPIVLGIILFGPRLLYACFVEAFILLTLYEFFSIAEFKAGKSLKWVAIIGGLVLSISIVVNPDFATIPSFLIILFMAFVLLSILLKVPSSDSAHWVAFYCLGLIYIGVCLTLIIPLRDLNNGPYLVILVLAATWANDTLAYITGKTIGRHKMAPSLSPSKTWEGFLGGLLGSILACYLMKSFFIQTIDTSAAILIGLASGIIGPIGDLFESLLKRAAGIKDSGNILPGHGGVLDRIDALIFNIPLFYFFALWNLQ